MSARMTFKARIAPALGFVALLCGLTAAPASAGPLLGLDLTRTETPAQRGDERLVYELKVRNDASNTPVVGDVLTCESTAPSGSPTPTVAYQWLRSGEAISGATDPTYTVAVDDEGELLQCRVTATNDADGAGSLYAPVSSTAVSLSPVAVQPVASPAALSGTTQAGISLIRAATPSATATVSEGSELLTDVFTAEGEGTLTADSDVVTAAKATTGTFENGQAIVGTGIPADTAIGQLKETAPGVFEFKLIEAREGFGIEVPRPATASGTMSDLQAGSLPFGAGQTISGAGIPADTEVLVVTKGGLKGPEIVMSNKATASGTEVAVSGTAELTCSAPSGWSGEGISWELKWLRNGMSIATGPSYVVQGADTAPPSILQCEAVGVDAGGNAAVAVSVANHTWPSVPAPNSTPGIAPPKVTLANQTSGPVTVELELPAGEDTFPYRVSGGFGCTKEAPSGSQHGSVTCTRSDSLAPQSSYPPIEVIVALGQNPPVVLTAKARVFGGGSPEPPPVEDTFELPPGPAAPFGFEAFEVSVLDELGAEHTQAGGHPFSVGVEFEFKTHTRPDFQDQLPVATNGSPKEIRTETPRGFAGNALAPLDHCPSVDAVLELPSTCPPGSVVGEIDIKTTSSVEFKDLPIYVLKPEYGTPAEFAFGVADIGLSYTVTPELRAAEGYAITLVSAPIPKLPELVETQAKLCAFGAKTTIVGVETRFDGCRKAGEPGAFEKPLVTNPTRCAGPPPTTRMASDSWEHPGVFVTISDSTAPLKECENVAFEPQISLKPTSNRADAPTGLDVELTMPTEGLEEPEGISQAHLKSTKVTFPEGMAINASAGHGLGSCSAAQMKLATNDPIECPASSKIGTMEVETPILEDTLQGDVYIAKQGDVKGALSGLYVVFDSKENGILIKIPAAIEPDPKTGRLTVSLDQSPEAPFSRATLHFPGGPRAALITPPKCGKYAIKAEIAPWSAADPDHPTKEETVTQTSSFQVNRGPDGGACPTGALEPKLDPAATGATLPTAGKTSPFVFRLYREDGTQRFAGLTMKAPKGLTAYLKGILYCPQSTIDAISRAVETGRGEITNPSCPAASRIGTVIAGAGAGPSPFYVDTGRAYLAPPYKGAPASIVVVAPAVAGPLDLGSVVVQNAVHVDPETAQVTIASDPIPTILHGVLPDIRDIRVAIDRPNFTLNPTSCEEKRIEVEVKGEQGATATVSNRFQVGGCDQLSFKPKIATRLFGPTGRGGHPKLRGIMTNPGEANLRKAVVTVPRSEFLDQAHIRTICTRVQFAAKSCPKGSIYGHIKAITPLLDYPLQGPVYLRSSDNKLPDLVATVRGPAHQPIEAAAVARVDSIKGQIRASFEDIPDVPLTKVILTMQGARKGLLVNSRDICAKPSRLSLQLEGHNGAIRKSRPVLRNGRCGKGDRGSR